jgi:3-dehydroquinate synthase
MNEQPFYLFESIEPFHAHIGKELKLSTCVWVVDEGFCSLPIGIKFREKFQMTNFFLYQEAEEGKNWLQLEKVLLWMCNQPCIFSTVVALGGGACLDLAGLAAHLFKRGVELIHLPTTLLATIDAAVGGKCAVNFGGYKNMVGAFHPAVAIYACIEFLGKDYHQPWIQSGLSEVYKHGLIGDKKILELYRLFMIEGTSYLLGLLIERSVALKQKVVRLDLSLEYRGVRDLLNLGHTVAHALESASRNQFSIDHGQAVAIGIMIESCLFYSKEKLNLLSLNQIFKDLSPLILEVDSSVFQLSVTTLLQIMKKDKKNSPQSITLSITLSNFGSIGDMIQKRSDIDYLYLVSDEEFINAWQQCKLRVANIMSDKFM